MDGRAVEGTDLEKRCEYNKIKHLKGATSPCCSWSINSLQAKSTTNHT